MSKAIKTFVFLDLETTGLPYMEHNLTKITEICAIAVQADHIELGCFPRVHNKLTLCFNPRRMISPESTSLTGLSNDLLEEQGDFSSDVVTVIKKWLEISRKPICLVAHNGNRFDYPILRAEIAKTENSLPDDLLCLDSLSAFRGIDCNRQMAAVQMSALDDDSNDEILWQVCDEYEASITIDSSKCEVQRINETTPKKQIINSGLQTSERIKAKSSKSSVKNLSYKLQDVYSRLTSLRAKNCHEAEGDVIMLVTCAAAYGEEFISYANNNSKHFTEIPPMRPGKSVDA